MKLSLGVLLMAIIIFVVSLGLLFLQSRWIIRQQAMSRANSVLSTTMHRITRFLSTVETACDINEWLVMKSLQPDSLLACSRLIVMLNGNVNGCSITTKPNLFPQYGRYFSAYTIREGDSIITEREKEYEYFDKVWYKTPYTLGKPCWVDPFYDNIEGLHIEEAIASYWKPLYRQDGEFVGVISTDLSLPTLYNTIATEHPYPNAYFIMTGREGQYLIHPDSTRVMQQTIFSHADPDRQSDLIALGHEMTAGHQGAMWVIIDQRPCLVCYQPVPGTPWSLAIVCPESDILKPYYKLAYILIPLLIAGMLLILLFCLRSVSMDTMPLNHLLHLSQQIAEGNLSEQIPHSSRQDAIGRLQNSFAAMQESIDRHVSDIRQANEEATRRNEQLAAARKAAEEADRQKTLFIQNMTHQIRTPLNIIMGFAQVLRDDLGLIPEEEVRSITDMMGHNTKTLNRMVLMLFDSSDSGLAEELKTHKHETVNCVNLARECIKLTKERFSNLNISLEYDVSDDLCMRTNRKYLIHSLLELLYNAAKYSDGQHIKMKVTQTGPTVSFIFQDTGPGIPESYRERMYTPFTKVNDLSEGLGLGLPLVLRHVSVLGGKLILDEDYHDGCRFTVELPL